MGFWSEHVYHSDYDDKTITKKSGETIAMWVFPTGRFFEVSPCYLFWVR